MRATATAIGVIEVQYAVSVSASASVLPFSDALSLLQYSSGSTVPYRTAPHRTDTTQYYRQILFGCMATSTLNSALADWLLQVTPSPPVVRHGHGLNSSAPISISTSTVIT